MYGNRRYVGDPPVRGNVVHFESARVPMTAVYQMLLSPGDGWTASGARLLMEAGDPF